MNAENSNTRVGFIGLGLMGGSMAGHILAAGYPLNVYNRSREKADALVAKGALLSKCRSYINYSAPMIR